MKIKPIYVPILIISIMISACSATPSTPSISGVDVQKTAEAAAFTIVAETQAARPTDTMVPPTETPTQTPLPTNTSAPLATETPLALVPQLATATQAVPAGGNTDPCNALLKANPQGRPTKIKLDNRTGAPITASIYLNITPFGECGFRGYNIAKGGAVTITDLVQGCYNISVLVNDPQRPTKSFGSGCVNNTDVWTFVIRRDGVSY